MMDVEEEPESENRAAVSCTTQNAKFIYMLLSCLSDGKKDQTVLCDVDADGLTFTAHSKAKSLQIKTTLTSSMFDAYEIDQGQFQDVNVRFRVRFAALMECLAVFGTTSLSTTSVSLSYSQENCVLSLLLEEHGVLTECQLRTLVEDDDAMELGPFESAFEEAPVLGKIIMKSDALRDAFTELSDLPKAACVRLSMTPQAATSEDCCFQLSAQAEAAVCTIDFGACSSALVEVACDRSMHATYHLAVLSHALRAVNSAAETFIRINSNGMLSVQHMLESPSGVKGFVDALLSAEEI